MRGRPPPSPRRPTAALVAAFTLAALVVPSACGTTPVGVEACQKIEKVRCESAAACGIDLGRPLHTGDSAEQNVAACTRYYDDQCLHGIVAPTEPGPQAVDACVDAIIKGDCSVVKAPETHPACKFLVPPAPKPASTADAAIEAEASAP